MPTRMYEGRDSISGKLHRSPSYNFSGQVFQYSTIRDTMTVADLEHLKEGWAGPGEIIDDLPRTSAFFTHFLKKFSKYLKVGKKGAGFPTV